MHRPALNFRSASATLLLLVVAGSAYWHLIHRQPPSGTPELQIPPPSADDRTGSMFSPEIRVNLTPASIKELQLAIDGPFRIQPAGSSQILHRGNKLAACLVTPTGTGFRIGGKTYPVTRLEIVADDPPAVWVGDHQYRGRVRIYRQPNERLIAVNVLPLDEYLASVIDGEMPSDFPEAAREAQAVVARTYALYQMQEARQHPYFDLFATTRSQKYLGYQYRDKAGRRLAGESEASRKIARRTSGLVCTYQGRIFCTYYSAVCGGETTEGTQVFTDAAPPLQSVACSWCREARHFRWTAELSKTEAAQTLAEHFRSQGQAFRPPLTAIRQTFGGPIPRFEVSDGSNRHTLAGSDLRRIWSQANLLSANFSVRPVSDQLQFAGRGHGHGVGLCQWGARGQGRSGRNCLQILNFYYPDCEIVILEDRLASGNR
jgi:stage II sporulation protein D